VLLGYATLKTNDRQPAIAQGLLLKNQIASAVN
jgi:hypothetical protein